MEPHVPLRCPACEAQMQVTQLSCPTCDTQVQGHFSVSPLLHLNKTQIHFVEVFLQCRGNIREVERALNISYPTVRARLDDIVQALGYTVPEAVDERDRLDTIRQFEIGEISFEETLDRIRKG